MCQPPNNPNLHVLDLGFFRAIQSLKDKTAPKNFRELVRNVLNWLQICLSKEGKQDFPKSPTCHDWNYESKRY